ncbi:hypothetical protein Taro_031904 [Colocasia esculenta]|uniref:WW domain-containing protein n=1 Tax=Colocasia esculenta TaxID=4460 RepID=A0A843VQ20_COLES|nr:hypothetical protein [Colocasia esculenta]
MHSLQQNPVPYSQGQTLQVPIQQLGQLQIPHSGGLAPLTQGVPSQQLIGLGGQLPTSQPVMQHLNVQQQGMSAANQQQLAASNIPHQLLSQPVQQSPTHIMLQQQTQSLQSTFQSTQQAFSQLQQQLQQMQPTLNQQQSSQATKQQSPWSGAAQPPVSSSPATGPTAVSSSTMSTTATPVSTLTAESLTCNWTEHTSPEGYKYYYNSVTKESKWEKPEELTLFEQQQQQKLQLQLQQQQNQQQQQQKSVVPQLQSQSQPQLLTQVPSAHHIAQLQQVQAQMQIRQQAPTQFLQPSLAYQASGAVSHQNTQVPGVTIDPVRVQQGLQAAQEWIWKNKPAGKRE